MPMRHFLFCLTVLSCLVTINDQAFAQPTPPKPDGRRLEAQAPAPACDPLAVWYKGKEFSAWPQREVDGKPCRVSPTIQAPRGYELNHYRVIVDFTGAGSVRLSLAHSSANKLNEAIVKRHLHSGFGQLKSGREAVITSPYKGERFAWLILQTAGDVKVTDIRLVCWRGSGTLYGHVARVFKFSVGRLPYRLMYPRNYDPSKSYPLVMSVSGSGGVGSRNVRSMEMVILGRYLFTKYYHDEELACFSLVPQISPLKVIPAPYWPRGQLGRPTPVYHPDAPAVNENGWYSRATLALIQSLIADESLNIDPDRIYYSGFSYGGKGCWEFLKAGRETFAAAMCGAGWPIGRCYCDPTGKLLERLKLEVQRYKHIPVFIFAGGLDRMRFGSRAVHTEILAQGGKSTYVEFPKTSHVGSAGGGWGNRKHVAWLFQQNRKNNPAAGKDPFPGGIYPAKR